LLEKSRNCLFCDFVVKDIEARRLLPEVGIDFDIEPRRQYRPALRGSLAVSRRNFMIAFSAI